VQVGGGIRREARHRDEGRVVRSPADVVRLVFAAVVLGVALVVARRSAGRVASVEDDLLRAMSRLVPLGPRDAAVGLAQWVAVVVPVTAAVALVALRRLRALVLAVAAAGLAAAVTAGLGRALLEDTHPFGWAFVLVEPRWLTTAAFPSPAYVAGAAAVVAALASWLPRPWRRVGWAALVLLVLVRVAGGTELPLDALVALCVGLGAAALVLLVAGAPRHRPSLAAVEQVLAAAGLDPDVLEIAGEPRADDELTVLRAVTTAGPVVVEVRSTDARSRDLLYRLWRRARPRGPADREVFTSLLAGSEHQALAATWARRAGARTAQVLAVGVTPRREVLLVHADRGERALPDLPPDEITEEVLGRAWAEMGKLHEGRIVHGAPTLRDLSVDRAGRAGVSNLRHARLGAPARLGAADDAQLLVASSRAVGVERAVAVARVGVGPAAVAAAAPFLEPVALEQVTGTRWRDQPAMRELRARLAAPDQPVECRIRGRAIGLGVAATLVLYLLLPVLAAATGVSAVARDLDVSALLPAVIAVVLLPAAWAVAFAGAAGLRIPIAELCRLRLRVAFAEAFTVGGRGGRRVGRRFLAAAVLDRRERDGAAAVLSLSSAASLVLLFGVFYAWSDSTPGPDFDLPSSSTTLVVIGVALAVAGLARRIVQARARPPGRIRAVAASVAFAARRVSDRPTSAAKLLGGSLAEPLLQAFVLVASVRSFGATTSYSDVGACYVTARLLAGVAGTPGGIGAYEAVAVAGLTGVGIDPAPAVLAVVVQRVLGWWVVVLGGWWAMRAQARAVTR
jgi:undecaprenyl-diphosphatase